MKVLIIKANKKAREQLVIALESELFVVDATDDSREGSYMARTNEYDILIIDEVLPDRNGLDVCRELRDHDRHMPIIIITPERCTDKRAEILDAGADDCLSKPYSLRELMSRMKALVRRSTPYRTARYSAGDLILDCGKQEAYIRRKQVHLTNKEYLLLELLFRNKGHVVSRGMIMEYVWQNGANPFSKTIETHMMNLRKKLSDCRDLVCAVQGRGYKISDE